ncbi:MAG: L,D-transpeptidase family protein [Candidatus Omnitrophica bacterium]|nr:L,D-transpeptidase family protein [Candidatus Omnitrophota bacterium]
MKNKLVGAGIAALLIVILGMMLVFGSKKEAKTGFSPGLKSVRGLISQDKLDEARAGLDERADKISDSGAVGKAYFDLASAYEKNKETVKARDVYQVVLEKYQNVDNILDIQDKVGQLNVEILFSPVITEDDVWYEIEPGDTLSKIAKKFGTTVGLLKASNSLDSDVIRAHTKIKVSQLKYRILVDKSQNLLMLLTDDGAIFKVYPVSTGENSSTPVGAFGIVNRMKDPVWYTQGAIVPAESPDNILGSRWLGISKPGYGIHGTVDPDSVGQQATQGCVRMYNRDVEELFAIVAVGTEVTIVD